MHRFASEATTATKNLEIEMRLKSRLIEFASIGLLVAFAASDTFAQGAQPGGQESKGAGASAGASAAGKAGAPSSGPWTADNVTAARPFGDISVAAAGNTNDSVRTWSQGRSASERAELSGRCGVINSPANAARYPADAKQFCSTYMSVSAASPAPGGAPKANP